MVLPLGPGCWGWGGCDFLLIDVVSGGEGGAEFLGLGTTPGRQGRPRVCGHSCHVDTCSQGTLLFTEGGALLVAWDNIGEVFLYKYNFLGYIED